MSEADRMLFEGIGYELAEENDIEARYIWDNGKIKEQILINKLDGQVTKYNITKHTKTGFYCDEIKAVYLKLKELGWIE